MTSSPACFSALDRDGGLPLGGFGGMEVVIIPMLIKLMGRYIERE